MADLSAERSHVLLNWRLGGRQVGVDVLVKREGFPCRDSNPGFSTTQWKLRDSIPGSGKIFLFSANRLRCLWGHTQPCIKGVPVVAIFPGVRQPDFELTTKLHPVQRVGRRGACLRASKWLGKRQLYPSRFIPAVRHILLRTNKEIFEPGGRAVWGTLLQGSRVCTPLSAWMFISRVCCVGSDLCDQLVTVPEVSYRVCACLIVFELETSTVRRCRSRAALLHHRNKRYRSLPNKAFLCWLGQVFQQARISTIWRKF